MGEPNPPSDGVAEAITQRVITLESNVCPGGQILQIVEGQRGIVPVDPKVLSRMGVQSILATPVTCLMISRVPIFLPETKLYYDFVELLPTSNGGVRKNRSGITGLADPTTQICLVAQLKTADHLVAVIHEEGHLQDSKADKYFEANEELVAICQQYVVDGRLSQKIADDTRAMELWQFLVRCETIANRYVVHRLRHLRLQNTDLFPTDPKYVLVKKYLRRELEAAWVNEFSGVFSDRIRHKAFRKLIAF